MEGLAQYSLYVLRESHPCLRLLLTHNLLYVCRFQFQSYQGDSVACYQSVWASVDGLKQRCCYSYDWDSDDFSSLLLGQPYGGHVVDTVSHMHYECH